MICRPIIQPVCRPLVRSMLEPVFSGGREPSLEDLSIAIMDKYDALGVPVGWFDDGDISTMFSDVLGNPATLIGPVGMQLNKHKPYGPEMLANGDFSADAVWIKGTGWAIENGRAKRGAIGAGSVITQNLPGLVAGRWYKVELDYYNAYPGSPDVLSVDFRGGGLVQRQILAPGTPEKSGHYFTFMQAVAGNNQFTITLNGGAGYGEFDNVSIREARLCRAQTTVTARPTAQTGRLVLDGVDDCMATAQMDWGGAHAVTMVSGLTRLSASTAGQMFAELGPLVNSNDGTFCLYTSQTSVAAYGKGAGSAVSVTRGLTGGNPFVSTMQANFTPGTMKLRVTGQAENSITLENLKAPAVASFPMYWFSRTGNTNFLGGSSFGTILIGALVTPEELAILEAYMASKVGVTLP